MTMTSNGMHALGITAEYNPFHNGHMHQLEASARYALPDAVVVALSGDFVQRGEPAVTDKWARTEMALVGGADLVIEIPTYFCLASSDVYAGAAMDIFKSLGCVDMISFGSESGNGKAIRRTARMMSRNGDLIRRGSSLLTKKGLSYPRARQMMMRKMGADDEMLKVLSSPNDSLAAEYMRAWPEVKSLAVKRNSQSASRLRKMLKEGSDIEGNTPEICEDLIYGDRNTATFAADLKARSDRLFDLARYSILFTDAEEMEESPQGGEGISNRLKEAARSASDYNDLVMRTKTKRYTYTHVSRLIVQNLLKIRRNQFDKPEYLRILGFSDKGRMLLNYIKHNKLNGLPFITNVNKTEMTGQLQMDLDAADMYNVICGRDLKQYSDRTRKPVIM